MRAKPPAKPPARRWKKCRHRGDPSVVYSALAAGDGTYRVRGPGWLGLGGGQEMRVPGRFFEETYEEIYEEARDDEGEG